jgi:hypothetical protein
MKQTQNFIKSVSIILVLGLSLFIWITSTNFAMGLKNQNNESLNNKVEFNNLMPQKIKQDDSLGIKSEKIQDNDFYRKNLNSISEKYLNEPLEGYSLKKEKNEITDNYDKKKAQLVETKEHENITFSTGIQFIDMYFKDSKTKRDYIDITFFSVLFIFFILPITIFIIEAILKIRLKIYFGSKDKTLVNISETSTQVGFLGTLVGIMVLFSESSANFALIKSNLGIIFSTTFIGLIAALCASIVNLLLTKRGA